MNRLIDILCEVSEETGHEPGTYILEGKGWSVEQFQGPDVIMDMNQWCIEGDGITGQGFNIGRRKVVIE